MNKKMYVAPSAQLIALEAKEDVALDWYWGTFKNTASITGVPDTPVTTWDPWSAEANASTYKYD